MWTVQQKFRGRCGVDDDCLDVLQCFWIAWPTIGDDRFDTFRLPQAFGQHFTRVQIHVRAVRMIGLFADQQDLGRPFVRRQLGRR